MGIPLKDLALLLCDNQCVALNTSLPSSVLKRKRHAVSHHQVREAVAAKVNLLHIKGKETIADILTEATDGPSFRNG